LDSRRRSAATASLSSASAASAGPRQPRERRASSRAWRQACNGGREVLTRQGLVHGGQRGEPGRVTRVCRAATGDGDARHGALRAAEGFARLGDRDAAVLALRIAETAAARHGDGEDSARVRLAGERMLRAPADLARPAQPGS